MITPMFINYHKKKRKDSNIGFCCHCCTPKLTRGNTVLQSVKIPFDYTIIKKMYVTYTQETHVVLTKEFSDLEMATDGLFYYYLSEDETLKFDSVPDAHVQIKVELEDGTIFQSAIFYIEVIASTVLGRVEDDFTLIVNVYNLESSVISDFDLLTDTNNVYQCKFNFDNSWDNYNIEAVFHNTTLNFNYNSPIINGLAIIPEEVLKMPGILHIGVIGVKDNKSKFTNWSNPIPIRKSCN